MADEPVGTPSQTPPTPDTSNIAANTMAQLGSQEVQTPETAPVETPPVSPETTPTTTPPVQDTAQYAGLLAYAQEQGIDLGQQFQDDHQAFQAMVDALRYRQATEAYQPHLQTYLQHQPQFNQWLAQEQARQRQPEVKKQSWSPPTTYDEANRLAAQFTTSDPATGERKWNANTPLDVRQKVENYTQYVQDWRHNLEHNPMKALQPLIQEMVAPLLQQAREQSVQETHAQEMIRRNQEWLYEKDPKTNQFRIDPRTRTPLLSPQGQLFSRYLTEARDELGIQDISKQEMYALKQTQADLVNAQPQPAPTQTQRNEQFLQQANRKPNNGTPVVNGQMPAPIKGLTLAESLRSSLQQAGIDAGQEEALQLGLGT